MSTLPDFKIEIMRNAQVNERLILPKFTII